MKLGICLSGGGIRAIGFHLGVLARLAEESYFEKITFLSTVSGGSLAIGLIFALNGFEWPSSPAFLETCLPRAQECLTSQSLQSRLLRRVVRQIFTRPSRLFGTRADDLAHLVRKLWHIDLDLCELPEHPRWLINATCYETGKNWRFERKRMGDYIFGYSALPRYPIADAMAASAGLPGLIGPMPLDCSAFNWFRFARNESGKLSEIPNSPQFKRVHLWDGGVYDNLGLEALSTIGLGWREGVEFLVSSDASGSPQTGRYSRVRAMLRLTTGIMMDQNRALRSRAFVRLLQSHQVKHRGALIRIGNTAGQVLERAHRADLLGDFVNSPLSRKQVVAAATMKTSLKSLEQEEFEVLFRNGFETADCVLHAYNPDLFDFIGQYE